jgi:DNA-binding SARP family transcriptional activator
LQFLLLGPVEAWHDERKLALGPRKQRFVLGVLALEANRLVPVERLIELVWGDAPPATARHAIQVAISGLRSVLARTAPLETSLAAEGSGYVLRTDPMSVDVHRFRALLKEAGEAGGAGDDGGMAALLREALGLWRGPMLSGTAPEQVRVLLCQGLDEARLVAIEDWIAAELRLGRHRELLDVIAELAASYPLREGLIGQYMLALHRGGRTADALEVARRTRRQLVEELGLDPGAELRRMESAILRNDPGLLLDGPPATVSSARRASIVPAQLPADIASFTGRDRELARIDRALAATPRGRAVAIAAIQGSGGIGKSALAIHAAHRLAERFPDGQLYVNLQGATVGLAPLAPLEVLGRFLRALGLDGGRIPAELDEAAALYRSLVAGRRMLVLLDNAGDAAQVAPLLPGEAGCGVLVTSRRPVAEPEGAGHLHLEVLPADEAVSLLGRLAGERVDAEPEAAAEVARWCGYLPLALRIAGSRLAARPRWPVSALAERLADARHRLDELEHAEVGVRASFAVSRQQLGASEDRAEREAAEAFGLLGMLDGPNFGVPVASRVLDWDEERTERVLERLVDAELLETPAPSRYGMHDLLRLYSRELGLRSHCEQARTAALDRAFTLYARGAWRSVELLRPGDRRLSGVDTSPIPGDITLADARAALSWLEIERANLLAAIRQSAAVPSTSGALAVQLAQAMFGFFMVRGYWPDCVEANQVALQVARRLGDRAAEALAQNDLGVAHQRLGRYAESVACQQWSLTIYRELGDRLGQAASLNNLAAMHYWQAHYDEALPCLRECLAIHRELGYRRGQSTSLTNLGAVHERLGEYEAAAACLKESLEIDRELGDRQGEGVDLNNLGELYERQGRYAEALACHRDSLTISKELGDRRGQATSLTCLGIDLRRQGEHDEALSCLRESLSIHQELGDCHGEAESLRELGATLRALGRDDEARAQLHQALAIFEQLQTADADEVRTQLTALEGC